MKKTFLLTTSNKSPERHLDSIKHEIKKYIARERRKLLSEDVDFWDFDCKIGNNEQEASAIHISEINSKIMSFVTDDKESFYLEILAKPGIRTKK
ncbi:MAG: hypothetical protein KAQ98_06325 [Bacteriovoracaceae bacterium]|nr:hypothetical protein [Bacteriovoracaceae bacterium]